MERRKFQPDSVLINDTALETARVTAAEVDGTRRLIYGLMMEVGAEHIEEVKQRYEETVE